MRKRERERDNLKFINFFNGRLFYKNTYIIHCANKSSDDYWRSFSDVPEIIECFGSFSIIHPPPGDPAEAKLATQNSALLSHSHVEALSVTLVDCAWLSFFSLPQCPAESLVKEWVAKPLHLTSTGRHLCLLSLLPQVSCNACETASSSLNLKPILTSILATSHLWIAWLSVLQHFWALVTLNSYSKNLSGNCSSVSMEITHPVMILNSTNFMYLLLKRLSSWNCSNNNQWHSSAGDMFFYQGEPHQLLWKGK